MCRVFSLFFLSGGYRRCLPGPPRVGRQRRQPMQRPRPLAVGALDAILAMKWKFPAGAGAVFIDAATYRAAHISHQRDATRLRLIGALHATQVRRNLLDQTIRDHAPGCAVALAPIEGNPEGGTAGTTVKTG